MKGWRDLEDVVKETNPDVEVPCPNCDGTLAVWVEETEVEDEEGDVLLSDCSVTGFVHIREE